MIENVEKRWAIHHKIISEDTKYKVITMYAVIILLTGFFFNNPLEILKGMGTVLTSSSILLTDYMEIANIGTAFFNSGLMMLGSIFLARKTRAHMNGYLIAAVSIVGGFAMFGKNPYNVVSIVLGVYLYSRIQKERFGKFILIALFGTALGPLVSQITFGFGLPLWAGVLVGNIAGILTGIILPPLATSFVKFHQGFNLYNVGFTAGIIGTVFMAVFRSFGLETPTVYQVSQGNNLALASILGVYFGSFIVTGYLMNEHSFKHLRELMRQPGRLVSDFVTTEGFGVSLVNMGLLGFAGMGYVFLVKGELSGPTIGGIFTMIGFGAFGKHLRNALPVMLGVFLATQLKLWDVNSTGAILAALFGTTLAPISGQFGWKAGVLAGFLHMSMVMNVGYLHGGINLYNNGLSGGIVAATLVPILDAFREEDSFE
ncbi:DUF1576 domain-containing protein [Acidaminobacter hydrogenoformans]|uniref:DUF1576 domain-containing protein n=1 Tax=Acidaminobacter hydrogenoformans DSM 2784 TaxID=1120920 RepID=A0A1G5RY01_9FIRM|nr:DUF1576 domain-containing protein [Acidaminobacter hydrogenoformans]SCZ78994.1 Protein of unknown function [Acidaminobacter hydrogenoformans DSM 2784]